MRSKGNACSPFIHSTNSIHEQQKEMLDNKTHFVEDRIVSLSQPWIRPIVRGKAKEPTEFGVKISISVVNGYTFIDWLSFTHTMKAKLPCSSALWKNTGGALGNTPNGSWQIKYSVAVRTGRSARSMGSVYRVRDSVVLAKISRQMSVGNCRRSTNIMKSKDVSGTASGNSACP